MQPILADNRERRIDLVRGAAVVCMVQFHTIDSFASPATRAGFFGQLSVFFGGGAAPLFLALAGIGAAMSKHNLRRGIEIWSIAMLFRVQEWALGGDGASSTSLLRVDILNCIGVSLIALSGLLKLTRHPAAYIAAAAFFIGLAPLVLQSNVTGAYYLGGPGHLSLFPLFPWTGVACAGAAFSLIVQRGTPANVSLGKAAGVCLGAYAVILVARLVFPEPLQFAALNHNIVFTLERTALSLGLLAAAPLFPLKSILLQLGRHSLLIYWVHVELVYGLWFHGKKATLGPGMAAAAALIILGAMWLLSYRPRRMHA